MQRTHRYLSALGVLGAVACGDGGASNPVVSSDAGATAGDAGDEQMKPSQGNGPCGKGRYPSEGSVSFCGEPEEGCTPLSEAADYTSFYGDVYVTAASDLEPLACFKKAQSLSLFKMPELENLEPLGNLVHVSYLTIQDSPKFKSLAGVKPGYVDTLSIANCGFEDMGGLTEAIELDAITIEDNENLTSLAGLERVTITDLIAIRNNPKLPECEAQAFAARFPDVQVVISGNDSSASCP